LSQQRKIRNYIQELNVLSSIHARCRGADDITTVLVVLLLMGTGVTERFLWQ
jgi:hypothetical protein